MITQRAPRGKPHTTCTSSCVHMCHADLMASDVVVFELRVALYVFEDGHIALSLRERVSLEGRDESWGEKSF